MDPRIDLFLESYFRTFNEGDEAGNWNLMSPNVVYFSSTVMATLQGQGAFKGVWKAIREGIGVRRIELKQVFGNLPEAAVLVSFQGEGGRPSVEAFMVFRFNSDNLIERLGVHWHPGAFLNAKASPGEPIAIREHLEDKDPRVLEGLKLFFQAFNAGDESGRTATLHPDLAYYGTLSGMESEGRASAMGIFRSAKGSLGISRLTPKRALGDWPELSVLVDLSREDGTGTAECVYVFRFDESGLIRRLAILWNPLPFLKSTPGI